MARRHFSNKVYIFVMRQNASQSRHCQYIMYSMCAVSAIAQRRKESFNVFKGDELNMQSEMLPIKRLHNYAFVNTGSILMRFSS